MPFTHAVEDDIVHFSWHGVITREDLQTFGKNMPALAASLGTVPFVLHTFKEVQGYRFQPLVVYTFSLLRKRAKIPYPVKSAVVVDAPEKLAMARLFKACNHSPNLTIEIFESEERARAWLAGDEDDFDLDGDCGAGRDLAVK